MNAHALMDFFNVRCCQRAQREIRDMANKMLKLVKEDSPTLFKDAGPNCKKYLFCPELEQHEICRKAGIPTREDVKNLVRSR